MALTFSDKAEAEIKALLPRYPAGEAALIPVLTLAAQEYGALTDDVIDLVSTRLGIPPTRVLATATFYTMLPKKPVGKHHVQVCTNIACSLLGAEHVVEKLERKLGIRRGETTADGLFTLSEVECLGSCGSAPVMMVNETFHENLDEDAIDRVLEECRRG
ncbi:MAG: NADH-quinone oxidoreductase subunit NuoE [Deltaproteobacteria bacterium]|nr:NADH-quinone oxidoreductase subunit NuoE [Deltaproteobacteria bacterium]